MITVSISGRKATLLKTAELPSGNDNSIEVNFIFSSTDSVWKDVIKVAIFTAVTARGLRKTLPAVINSDGECRIPGKILSTPFSKVFVGAMATYEDGSTVSSNLVFINETGAGAGGDNIYDEECPIDKNDFDMFMADIAAGIGAQVAELNDSFIKLSDDVDCINKNVDDINENVDELADGIVALSEDVSSLETLTEPLGINSEGKLVIDDEPVLDYATWFHRMTRYCADFTVESYWELSSHDIGTESIDVESGSLTKRMVFVDLRPGTRNGDKAFVKYSEGNYLTPSDIPNYSCLIPEISVVYPIVYIWQSHIPEPDENEDKSIRASATFSTHDGKRYVIERYFDETFNAWVITFSPHGWDGTFVYSWVTTDVLEENSFVLIKDGAKVEHIDWPSYAWPTLIDVMCQEANNAEKFEGVFLDYLPINYHPSGSYVYDDEKELWKIQTGTSWYSDFVIKKEMWSFNRRITLCINGLVPGDQIHLTACDTKAGNIELNVVNKGYSHMTIECPEKFAEIINDDIKVSLSYKNLVERNDTFGLWSEW